VSEQVTRPSAEHIEYRARLAAHPSRPFVVPSLIAINIAVYAILGAKGAGWVSADPKTLVDWGSNFGPLTTSGEWWRLFTAMFLHGGVVHLLVNMYALYDTGRLSEQLYGHARFFALYVASGLAGSAASVWWNPGVNSVGASGAIFGVFGAMLVYMLDKRNGVPPSIMKSHQASTGIFIVYALMNGMSTTGIDNAAHVGGLLGGAIMGWALARPVGQTAPTNPRAMRPIVGIVVVAASIAALLLVTRGTNAGFEAHQRFIDDVRWVEAEEKTLLAETKALLERARKKDAKEAELGPKFAIVGERWRIAHDRLSGYHLDPGFSGGELVRLQNEIVGYLGLRHRSMTALVAMIDAPDKSAEERARQQEFERLWKESGAALQRIQTTSKAIEANKK
jgi:rhomboid protease GluP